MQVIPNRKTNSISVYCFLLAVVTMLMTACFSGKTEKQSARGRSAEQSSPLDTFRLSQLTLPTNVAFGSVLDELDKRDLRNIDRAITVFNACKADSLSRDSMLISFNEYLNAVMEEYYQGKLSGNRPLMDQFENREQPEAKKLTEEMAAHGISLTYRDGDFYLEPNSSFIYDRLGSALTSSSRNYLQIKTNLAKGMFDDKNQPLSVPDSLARQVAVWEDFLVRNPGYVMKDEIQAQYIDVLAAYLSGTEQTPLFDPDTKLLNPDFKSSYLHYVESHPTRESAQTVKKFYELLAAKGFKYDETVDSFLTEVNFIPTQKPQ